MKFLGQNEAIWSFYLEISSQICIECTRASCSYYSSNLWKDTVVAIKPPGAVEMNPHLRTSSTCAHLSFPGFSNSRPTRLRTISKASRAAQFYQ